MSQSIDIIQQIAHLHIKASVSRETSAYKEGTVRTELI